MGVLSVSNFRKAFYYLRKNGIKNTWYAVWERLLEAKGEAYRYLSPSEVVLAQQRQQGEAFSCTISILVPAYETPEAYLRQMVDSLLAQSYGRWELIVADASRTAQVRKVMEQYQDRRIRYLLLEDNRGISENTNAALAVASGDYVGLLDHDDVLTPDALYEMVLAIQSAEKNGKTVAFAYSDEDKCDAEAKRYYEPHVKSRFTLDLLFSNNYICHFLVIKAELMKKTGFRKEYDGAQDFDLVLRAFLHKEPTDEILHVNKVLYHWRCHESSTAANPQSKLYAYEAGKRAVESALEEYWYSVAVRRREKCTMVT